MYFLLSHTTLSHLAFPRPPSLFHKSTMQLLIAAISRRSSETPVAHRSRALNGATSRMKRSLGSTFGCALSVRSQRRLKSIAPPSSIIADAAGTPAVPRTRQRSATVTASRSSNSAASNHDTPRRGDKRKQARTDRSDHSDILQWMLPSAIDAASEAAMSDTTDAKWERSRAMGHGFMGRPSTEFLGWRRMHIEDVVGLDKGDFFILIVPVERSGDRDEEKALRNQFTKRMLAHVYSSYPDVPRDKLFETMKDRHGVKRDSKIFIELPCCVSAYPKRDLFENNQLEKSELSSVLAQGGGLGVRLLDYPSRDRLDIKWNEANALQFWIQHFRGDTRHRVHLGERQKLESYCDDLDRQLHDVRDDPLQTLELALMYEERKSMILRKKLTATTRGKDDDNDVLPQLNFEAGLLAELSHGNLQNFATRVDNIYKESFHQKYSEFSPRAALVDPANTAQIRQDLKASFPLHYAAFQSLIFTKRNLQPADRKLPVYRQKEKSLVNHFMALIRLRSPKLLIYWQWLRLQRCTRRECQ